MGYTRHSTLSSMVLRNFGSIWINHSLSLVKLKASCYQDVPVKHRQYVATTQCNVHSVLAMWYRMVQAG